MIPRHPGAPRAPVPPSARRSDDGLSPPSTVRAAVWTIVTPRARQSTVPACGSPHASARCGRRPDPAQLDTALAQLDAGHAITTNMSVHGEPAADAGLVRETARSGCAPPQRAIRRRQQQLHACRVPGSRCSTMSVPSRSTKNTGRRTGPPPSALPALEQFGVRRRRAPIAKSASSRHPTRAVSSSGSPALAHVSTLVLLDPARAAAAMSSRLLEEPGAGVLGADREQSRVRVPALRRAPRKRAKPASDHEVGDRRDAVRGRSLTTASASQIRASTPTT